MDIQFNSQFLNSADVLGGSISINATHPNHIGSQFRAQGANGALAQGINGGSAQSASSAQGGQILQSPENQPSFGQMLFDAINDVSREQNFANDISVQAITNPDSVEAHDVTIALARANLSLSITRNVVDRVVQAYREITTLR